MRDRVERPAWSLSILAASGFLLSGYLWFGTGGAELGLCPPGSGCQVVQASRYATLLGIPLPVYGLAYYGTLLVLSGWSDPVRRWRLVLPVAAAGAAASLVFLGVQGFVLRTFCSLCSLSALISFAIFGMSWVHAGRSLPWRGVLLSVAATFVFVLGGYWLAERQAATNPYAEYAEGLARHLAASGAKFYGAHWCPYCNTQKRMFGQAARFLPYVECDPRSPEGRPQECAQAGVLVYPTWIIQGRKYEGLLLLEDLARLSGYPPPPLPSLP